MSQLLFLVVSCRQINQAFSKNGLNDSLTNDFFFIKTIVKNPCQVMTNDWKGHGNVLVKKRRNPVTKTTSGILIISHCLMPAYNVIQ